MAFGAGWLVARRFQAPIGLGNSRPWLDTALPIGPAGERQREVPALAGREIDMAGQRSRVAVLIDPENERAVDRRRARECDRRVAIPARRREDTEVPDEEREGCRDDHDRKRDLAQ